MLIGYQDLKLALNDRTGLLQVEEHREGKPPTPML